LQNNEEQRKEKKITFTTRKTIFKVISKILRKSRNLIIPDENKNWTRHLQDKEIYLDMIEHTAEN
jgi:hypothetical protein